jgi:hypothetical protein
MGGALGAAYTYQESQPMTVSMVGVLTDLPIRQTRLQDRVHQHQNTFTAN